MSEAGSSDVCSNGTSTGYRVLVRVRPPYASADLPEDDVAAIQEEEPIVVEALSRSRLRVQRSERSEDTMDLQVDEVFDMGAQQADVFRAARDVITGVVAGQSGTILAYGQTGSGKTFTMTGDTSAMVQAASDPETMRYSLRSKRRGLIPRALETLFNSIQPGANLGDGEEGPTFRAYVSFMEIYSEKVYDLLAGPRSATAEQAAGKKQAFSIRQSVRPPEANLRRSAADSLPIKEEKDGTVSVPGITVVEVKSMEQALEVLRIGILSRTSGDNGVNPLSSRSHAIFQVVLEKRSKGSQAVVSSKLNLVDLAGSEKLRPHSSATGPVLQELTSINLALSALGQCISALVAQRTHVPYRDSKLTRILQDSLRGQSQTVMCICISPNLNSLEETLSSLKFADRCKRAVLDRRSQAAGSGDDTAAAAAQRVEDLMSQLRLLQEELRTEREQRRDLEERLRGGGAGADGGVVGGAAVFGGGGGCCGGVGRGGAGALGGGPQQHQQHHEALKPHPDEDFLLARKADVLRRKDLGDDPYGSDAASTTSLAGGSAAATPSARRLPGTECLAVGFDSPGGLDWHGGSHTATQSRVFGNGNPLESCVAGIATCLGRLVQENEELRERLRSLECSRRSGDSSPQRIQATSAAGSLLPNLRPGAGYAPGPALTMGLGQSPQGFGGASSSSLSPPQVPSSAQRALERLRFAAQDPGLHVEQLRRLIEEALGSFAEQGASSPAAVGGASFGIGTTIGTMGTMGIGMGMAMGTGGAGGAGAPAAVAPGVGAGAGAGGAGGHEHGGFGGSGGLGGGLGVGGGGGGGGGGAEDGGRREAGRREGGRREGAERGVTAATSAPRAAATPSDALSMAAATPSLSSHTPQGSPSKSSHVGSAFRGLNFDLPGAAFGASAAPLFAAATPLLPPAAPLLTASSATSTSTSVQTASGPAVAADVVKDFLSNSHSHSQSGSNAAKVPSPSKGSHSSSNARQSQALAPTARKAAAARSTRDSSGSPSQGASRAASARTTTTTTTTTATAPAAAPSSLGGPSAAVSVSPSSIAAQCWQDFEGVLAGIAD